MYQELAIQTLLISNLIDIKTLEIVNEYMIDNLLFIVKPLSVLHHEIEEILVTQITFKYSKKL